MPGQLDLSGDGGTTSSQTVRSTTRAARRRRSRARSVSSARSSSSATRSPRTSPPRTRRCPCRPSARRPPPDISFNVPAGLDRLDADMIWPDATNGTILNFVAHRPERPAAAGLLRLRRRVDARGPARHRAEHPARRGRQPRGRHLEGADQVGQRPRPPAVAAQRPGHLPRHGELPRLRAELDHLAGRRPRPRSRRTASATIPLQVAFPKAPGDHPESVQFTAANGAKTSLPIARRTLIPSTGGEFDTLITSSVGRGIGQISTFNVNVPAGRADLGVTLRTPDTSTDNPMRLFLVNPLGRARDADQPDRADDQRHADAGGHVPRRRTRWPGSGRSTSSSTCRPAARSSARPWWATCCRRRRRSRSPADGRRSRRTQPLISGTGTPGDTVTVSNGTTVVCTAVVAADGTWSCTPSLALPGGPATLTATQADQTGNLSAASAPLAITVPSGSTSTTGTVAGNDAGDAGAHARRAGLVRRVHAGRRRDLHGVDHGQRGQRGGRRDAERLSATSVPPEQRHVLPARAAAWSRSSKTQLVRPGLQRPGDGRLQRSTSAPTTRCAPAATARR